jgi:hypothetical protein
MNLSPRLIVMAASAATLLLAAAPAAAAAPAGPPKPVATGLDNPRGLAFGPHGELYVAEAGRGGDGPCLAGPEGGTVCFGSSGAVTRVAHGSQRRIQHGLPSLADPDGAQAIGASDVAVDAGGGLLVTVGLGADPGLRAQVPQLAGMARLYRDGRPVADLGAYERSANPDGVSPPDTNPNAVLASRGGAVVADAGGNSLVQAGRRGRLSTVATFTGPSAGVQAVPTSITRGPDGAYYVGELTGYPFTPGTAVVWRVVPGHRPTVYAAGLTNVIDLAWGPGGLYVLEIARGGLLSGDRTGALLRVDRHGKPRVIASEGLTAPGGLAIRGHDAYVSNCSVCAGTGSVVRLHLPR